MDNATLNDGRVGRLVAGKYELTKLLGSGGMGAVYEAVHAFTKRRVAVKLMHANFARSQVAAERFLREAQAPSTIGHPGIIEVLDGGRDEDGSLYLVLELLEGETLAEALRRGRPALPWLTVVVLELLDALQAAHDAGFTHRDIKPDNVFLVPTDTGEPLVKLLDFGVAGVVSGDGAEAKPNLTRIGAVLGTPLYMSPEQALGRRVDGRTDLWAVGAVLYQMLTGKPPFAGDNMQQLIVSISTEEHLPLSVARPGLPLRVVKVVERALQKDPEQRWQSAQEMADALRVALPTELREAADGLGQAALRRGERAAPTGLQPRQVVMYAAPALLLLVGIAAVLMLRRDRGTSGETRATREPAAEVAVGAQPNAPAPGQTAAAARPKADAAGAAQDTASAAEPSTAAPTAAAAEPRAAALPPSGTAGDSPTGTGTGTAAAAPSPDAPPTSAPTEPKPGLDQAALASVLAANDAALQRCHEEVLVAALMQPAGADPAQVRAVRLDLSLEIDPPGTVRSAEVRGDAPAALITCVRDLARGFRFPAAPGPTSARVPIVFTPNVVQR